MHYLEDMSIIVKVEKELKLRIMQKNQKLRSKYKNKAKRKENQVK